LLETRGHFVPLFVLGIGYHDEVIGTDPKPFLRSGRRRSARQQQHQGDDLA
jgi:hypothetical protein